MPCLDVRSSRAGVQESARRGWREEVGWDSGGGGGCVARWEEARSDLLPFPSTSKIPVDTPHACHFINLHRCYVAPVFLECRQFYFFLFSILGFPRPPTSDHLPSKVTRVNTLVFIPLQLSQLALCS